MKLSKTGGFTIVEALVALASLVIVIIPAISSLRNSSFILDGLRSSYLEKCAIASLVAKTQIEYLTSSNLPPAKVVLGSLSVTRTEPEITENCAKYTFRTPQKSATLTLSLK